MHGGFVARGLEPVEAAFSGVVDRQPGSGAALAVWREGQWLVDLWGGTADAAGQRAWSRTSIVQPYSVSKPFVAVCALLLVERARAGRRRSAVLAGLHRKCHRAPAAENLIQWTQLPAGGHFPGLETPDALAADTVTFAGEALRAAR